MTAALHNEDILITDRRLCNHSISRLTGTNCRSECHTDLDARFTIGKLSKLNLVGALSKSLGDGIGQRGVRRPGEDTSLPHVEA